MASEAVVELAIARVDEAISRRTSHISTLEADLDRIKAKLEDKFEEIVELGLEKQGCLERWADSIDALDALKMERTVLTEEDEPADPDEPVVTLKDSLIRDIMGRKIPRSKAPKNVAGAIVSGF